MNTRKGGTCGLQVRAPKPRLAHALVNGYRWMVHLEVPCEPCSPTT